MGKFWNTAEGIALLWRAFPDGYAHADGVLTLGGWTSVAVESSPHSRQRCWFARSYTSPWVVLEGGCADRLSATEGFVGPSGQEQSMLRRGCFLPLPCPEDTATWAVLLKKLTDLLGWESAPYDVPVEAYKPRPIWGRALQRNIRGEWSIAAYGRVAGRSLSLQQTLGRWINTDDPSIVLIRAIAHYRKHGDLR